MSTPVLDPKGNLAGPPPTTEPVRRKPKPRPKLDAWLARIEQLVGTA